MIIINKNYDLISRYNELVDDIFHRIDTDSNIPDFYRKKDIKTVENLNSLILEIDRSILKNNISEEEFSCLTNFVNIVEYNYILAPHDIEMLPSYSYKDEDTLTFNLNEFKKEDEFFEDNYDIIITEKIKGSLKDNIGVIVSKYENGFDIFLEASSIYNKNHIKIAYR